MSRLGAGIAELMQVLGRGACRGWRGGRLSRAGAFFSLTREMRGDPKHSLDQHELTSMMHLVLFDAEKVLEARLGILPHRIRKRLSQKVGRD
jgi:hypothetical protein